MREFWKLSAAGFAATAVTYGPARMGFGLFLSEFRSSFELSTQAAGVISSLGFFGMLIGLFLAYFMTAILGPRAPVVTGLGLAAAGFATVAAATGPVALCAGVFLTMSSAGFAWSPFNNAVRQMVRDAETPLALSLVSTGTSVGIVLAGGVALGVGLSGLPWRVGWGIFGALTVLALLGAFKALRAEAGQTGPRSDEPWGALFIGAVMPLYAVALSFGITTSVFISFAADRIEQAGGLAGLPPGSTPSVVFITLGLFGLAGLFTDRFKGWIGLTALIRVLMLGSALSLALVAVFPAIWAGALTAAALQGVFVMMISATLAFWSARLFPTLPALSFTVALVWTSTGSVLGPIVAGEISTRLGGQAMFLIVAGISLATSVLLRPELVRERPAGPGGKTQVHPFQRTLPKSDTS